MKNDPKYIRLLQFVIDQGYTVDQVKTVSGKQAASLLNIEQSDLPSNFDNVRSLLIKDLQERDDKLLFQQFKS